ncbi:MAG: cell division protein FtsK [Candidatus Vogelbacteria bacterium CG10_big_fil_rev_8_21_14_0_10_45_14]|uniref:Cell division protein FtsK n=1 Tax=Candidatus Vogelbacteria bacterium CG10_big_fil_rev_8_21_14_0_10_45_14 TaxID=1975042 RepID=A0A2H0RJB5_9BACT|nr:MAG: cell division protein FtsK [Candidatus Vogelbacteria bacterium CG10_big_fil_rev_8_21_14_0_10_45_14]
MFSLFGIGNKRRRRAKRASAEVDSGRKIGSLLDEGTKNSILAIIFFLLAILFALALFGLAGPAGDTMLLYLGQLLGAGFILLPIVFLFCGLTLAKVMMPHIVGRTLISGSAFLLFGLALMDVLFRDASEGAVSGGILGKYISMPFIRLFDDLFGGLLLMALVLIALIVMFDSKLTFELSFLGHPLRKKRDHDIEVNGMVAKSDQDDEEDEEAENDDVDENSTGEDGDEEHEHLNKEAGMKLGGIIASEKAKPRRRFGKYVPPSLALLAEDSEKPSVGDIKANANLIKRTLLNFGIDVEMDEISIGPSVTRYALKPAEGVKLSRIVGLQNELSLALAAHPLRIEAPIPGKSLVGIEMPNKVKATVRLRTLLSSKDFQSSPNPLMVALGRGTSGVSAYTNIAKAPHMLIAGATGSGKSVSIHTMIASLLFRNGPEELRMIMIDPKRVELTLYNKIPHLLTPVITDPKKAILALKWAAKEMSRRYDVLESESVRDIQSYHKNVVEAHKGGSEAQAPERMPYIVIILDELADMMSTYPREFEASIVRLAQMSRAVGIHLILSTQRPSVEVITGLIKANVPSRVALQVPSQIDSRTILDMPGAEKLLGAGDMLFLGGEMSRPMRYQSPFISETEVKAVVSAIAKENPALSDDALAFVESGDNAENLGGEDPMYSSGAISLDDENEEDDLYGEAKRVVTETGKASTSYIQRRLKVGYSRAARLLDMLEEKGVVGPGSGAKPREVYGYGEGAQSVSQDAVYEEGEGDEELRS